MSSQCSSGCSTPCDVTIFLVICSNLMKEHFTALAMKVHLKLSGKYPQYKTSFLCLIQPIIMTVSFLSNQIFPTFNRLLDLKEQPSTTKIPQFLNIFWRQSPSFSLFSCSSKSSTCLHLLVNLNTSFAQF